MIRWPNTLQLNGFPAHKGGGAQDKRMITKVIKKQQIKKTIYTKGKSIDGQTHYGEIVLLTYSLLAK